MNPEPLGILHPVLRRDAEVSATLPLDDADRCPEDVLNRILWRALRGADAACPEWAALPPGGRSDGDDVE